MHKTLIYTCQDRSLSSEFTPRGIRLFKSRIRNPMRMINPLPLRNQHVHVRSRLRRPRPLHTHSQRLSISRLLNRRLAVNPQSKTRAKPSSFEIPSHVPLVFRVLGQLDGLVRLRRKGHFPRDGTWCLWFLVSGQRFRGVGPRFRCLVGWGQSLLGRRVLRGLFLFYFPDGVGRFVARSTPETTLLEKL